MPRTPAGFVIFVVTALVMFVTGAVAYQALKPYLPGFITSRIPA